jgi:hypothetical protein
MPAEQAHTDSMTTDTTAKGATMETLQVTDYAGNWEAHRAHTNGNIVGYFVIETIDQYGEILSPAAELAHFEGGGQYAEALELAQANRGLSAPDSHARHGSWAVVGRQHECGCVLW